VTDDDESAVKGVTDAMVSFHRPLTYEVEYLPEVGEVHAYWDSKLEEIIEVRASLLDKVTRIAAVEELRKLGYTIIEPADAE
jgi:hypothetical protein